MKTMRLLVLLLGAITLAACERTTSPEDGGVSPSPGVEYAPLDALR